MTYHIENPLSLIAFDLFLAQDRAYMLIACLSSESHLIILYNPFLVFGCEKEGAHSESFASSITPINTIILTSFLKIS